MWMASAVDFVMIFVSLELVTLSFLRAREFTRRNPATLEAGVKYLILGAFDRFLVYGITWISALPARRISPVSDGAGDPGCRSHPALFGIALVLVALGFKIAGCRSSSGAGCLSRAADAGDGFSFRRLEGGGIRRAPACPRAVFDAPRVGRLLVELPP